MIRTSFVIGHGIQTMATTLFTACCQCKQAPSATSILWRSVVRGAWGIHLCSFWFCIPQQHQQKHIWIINLSVSLLPQLQTVRRGSQRLFTGLWIDFYQKQHHLKKKNLYYHCQLLWGFYSKLHHHSHSFLDERWREQFIIAFWMRKGNLEYVQLMSAPSWDHCNLVTKWCHFFFFFYSNLKKIQSFTALKSV